MKIKSLFGLMKSNKKLLIIFFSAVTIAIAVFYLPGAIDAYLDKHDNELIIGFITDIHAGSAKTTEKGSGIITPANFEKNMTTAFKNMRDADYVVALGDNIDRKKGCQIVNRINLVSIDDRRKLFSICDLNRFDGT